MGKQITAQLDERIGRERFNAKNDIQIAVRGFSVRVTAENDHRNRQSSLPNSGDKFRAIHSRHQVVRYDQSDLMGTFGLRDKVYSRVPIAGDQDRPAGTLEDRFTGGGLDYIIVHEQYR